MPPGTRVSFQRWGATRRCQSRRAAFVEMARPPLYPPVPQTALEGRRWRWRGQLLSVQRAGRGHLESLDREWDLIPAPVADESAHWRFARLGTTRPERFVMRDQSGHYLGAWLDHNRLIGAKPSRWRGAQALTNLEFDDLGRLMEVLDGEVR